MLLYGGMAAVAGRMSVGTYSVLVFLIQRLLWPLTRLGADQYQRAMASVERVMNLLDTYCYSYRSYSFACPLSAASWNYGMSPCSQCESVIQNLSLHIPAGKTIAIVGSTGSGKSTLVKLLLRLYEVQAGTITLDGIELRDLKLKDLRSCIGLVSQDVFLFHGTVEKAYGFFSCSN